MSHSQIFLIGIILFTLATATGCDARLLVAGNLTLAVVPCVLLWVTVNLRKVR